MDALPGAGNFAIRGPRCILMHCDGAAADSTPDIETDLSADPCLEDPTWPAPATPAWQDLEERRSAPCGMRRT